MFQYLWPSSLTKIIRKKIRFSGKGTPKFTPFSIKLDEGISCKNVSAVFSSNHANNYKKLIKKQNGHLQACFNLFAQISGTQKSSEKQLYITFEYSW